MKIFSAIAVSVIALAFAGATAANATTTFTDGDFAEAVVQPYASFGVGEAFGPWTVTSGTVDLVAPNNYWPNVPNSYGSVDLNGSAPGSFQQTFIATPGSYALSFYLGANNYGQPIVKSLNVAVGGASAAYTYDTTGLAPGGIAYNFETLNFTSNGSPITLSFASGDGPSPYGAVVGGISISAVPETATWIMLLLGFGAIGWTLRDRRRQFAAAIA